MPQGKGRPKVINESQRPKFLGLPLSTLLRFLSFMNHMIVPQISEASMKFSVAKQRTTCSHHGSIVTHQSTRPSCPSLPFLYI